MELVDGRNEVTHLLLGVCLTLEIVVHQVVHGPRDELTHIRDVRQVRFLCQGGLKVRPRDIPGQGGVERLGGHISRQVDGGRADLLPRIGAVLDDRDELVLLVRNLRLLRRDEIEDVHRFGGRRLRKSIHGLNRELLDGSNHRVHLGLCVCLALCVVVHKVADRLGHDRVQHTFKGQRLQSRRCRALLWSLVRLQSFHLVQQGLYFLTELSELVFLRHIVKSPLLTNSRCQW